MTTTQPMVLPFGHVRMRSTLDLGSGKFQRFNHRDELNSAVVVYSFRTSDQSWNIIVLTTTT